MGGHTKEQLLARLQELQINFASYDHPAVLTVEAQAKYVGHLGGAVSKNLFLKDKKHRLYVVSALVGTTVDLKVLSQRLGLGKGGLRMAPEEALQEILQVPLGCVTPFALINETARTVSLLLDKRFKAHECCFFHPLTNEVTICYFLNPRFIYDANAHVDAEVLQGTLKVIGRLSRTPDKRLQAKVEMNNYRMRTGTYSDSQLLYAVGRVSPALSTHDLDKFLISIGRNPIYVDLEATPLVGKDQPPDLAALVPSETPSLVGTPEKAVQNPASAGDHAPAVNKSTKCTGETTSGVNATKVAREKTPVTAEHWAAATDVRKFIDEIIDKTCAAVLTEINKGSEDQPKVLGFLLDKVSKRIGPDLENVTMSFKNAAYTEGFHAGLHSVIDRGLQGLSSRR